MVDEVQVNKANEEAEEAYNTSDPAQVNKARKRAARTRADRLEFVKAAMDVEQGRAWFYDLLARCRVFNLPFNADPYITAFKCGELNVGNQVLSDIQDANPDQYVRMVREGRNR